MDPAYREEATQRAREWDVDRRVAPTPWATLPLPAQSEVIGAVNEVADPRDLVVCAAGSLPGDLHKLWRTRDPKGFHVEYGYSCMGYEIAGGMGAKMAAPDRNVFVMVGDGSYLMLAQELVTAVQERIPLIVVLIQNHGYQSIGALSESVGAQRFGTRYRYRAESGRLEGETLPVDLAANAASLGARAVRVEGVGELRAALAEAKAEALSRARGHPRGDRPAGARSGWRRLVGCPRCRVVAPRVGRGGDDRLPGAKAAPAGVPVGAAGSLGCAVDHVRVPPSCRRFDLLDDVDPHAGRVHHAKSPLTPRLVGQGHGGRQACLDQAGIGRLGCHDGVRELDRPRRSPPNTLLRTASRITVEPFNGQFGQTFAIADRDGYRIAIYERDQPLFWAPKRLRESRRSGFRQIVSTSRPRAA